MPYLFVKSLVALKRLRTATRSTRFFKQNKEVSIIAVELIYRQVGDYYIPNLVLTDQPDKPIGIYGCMHQRYLQKHRPLLYTNLLLSGELYWHLLDMDEATNVHIDVLMPQY